MTQSHSHATAPRKRAGKSSGNNENGARHESEVRSESDVKTERTPNSSTRMAVAGPAGPVAMAIAISFLTSSILSGSMLHVGPQYLEPLYGNVLPQVGFLHGVAASAILGGIVGVSYWRHMLGAAGPASVDTRTGRALAAAFNTAALLTSLAPIRASFVLRYSGRMGPVWGPTLTHCVLAYPVFAAVGFVTAVAAARMSHVQGARLRQAAVFAAYVLAAALAAWVAQLRAPWQHGCHGLLTAAAYMALSGLLVELLVGLHERAGALAARAPGVRPAAAAAARPAALRFAPAVATAVFVLTSLLGDARCTTRGAVSATAKYHVLMREESVTGWVTVADEHARGLRLLRSGHSIIGGHWNSTQESIFGVFYYADAVRLVRGAPQAGERALQIGLGIGVSARSLHEQHVRVDVVEIDPAVHRAAVDFFGLPPALNAVHLRDARGFIDEAPAGTYDYVVHDVFTGGSVPAPLFSREAVAQLRRIMRPAGVLAMNYVGVPSDARVLAHVAATLRTAFAHVRLFGEFAAADDAGAPLSRKAQMDSVVNMMFFASNRPIVFKKLAADGRSIRGAMLAGMLHNEISLRRLPTDGVQPLTDRWNPLTQWQVGTAVEHWHTMRRLFPEEYWLAY
ncbi:hypothetical protein LPJ53_002956 [Coemansia erecta]|uniref:PABS domain-containing protein n=1 Tax=Coemansia erecta TaxID=147472 RepID=A0A9W8CTA3_9FUNG|nr:hypothetical protein LPJ53_002956 [Coemansia erecta]